MCSQCQENGKRNWEQSTKTDTEMFALPVRRINTKANWETGANPQKKRTTSEFPNENVGVVVAVAVSCTGSGILYSRNIHFSQCTCVHLSMQYAVATQYTVPHCVQLAG